MRLRVKKRESEDSVVSCVEEMRDCRVWSQLTAVDYLWSNISWARAVSIRNTAQVPPPKFSETTLEDNPPSLNQSPTLAVFFRSIRI